MAGCEDYCDDDMEDPQAGRDQSTRQATASEFMGGDSRKEAQKGLNNES